MRTRTESYLATLEASPKVGEIGRPKPVAHTASDKMGFLHEWSLSRTCAVSSYRLSHKRIDLSETSRALEVAATFLVPFQKDMIAHRSSVERLLMSSELLQKYAAPIETADIHDHALHEADGPQM